MTDGNRYANESNSCYTTNEEFQEMSNYERREKLTFKAFAGAAFAGTAFTGAAFATAFAAAFTTLLKRSGISENLLVFMETQCERNWLSPV